MVVEKLKQGWIVRWKFYGSDEEKNLKKYGLSNKVIDIISARKNYDTYIIDYAKELYRQKMLHLTEKAYLASYNKGSRRQREMFDTRVPVFTSYRSKTYSDLIRCLEKNSHEVKSCKNELETWGEYPTYVIVGHNPAVEIVKVYNIKVFDVSDEQCLEWEEKTTKGILKTKRQ